MAQHATEPEEHQLIRIAKGNPNATELAALTAVLLARTAAVGADPDDLSRPRRAVAHWARPEREPGFTGPRTWQRRGDGGRDRAP
ncbi:MULTISPECIES: acyl-CoA carboxylase epsilon subunit [unclassified Streptomyces]|uniref:acyl-CoA carboxylase epsilon subunit n=1 Tax=unclassified Streptomyces TaxID=2593676 RepID=UPI003FCFDC17